MKKKLLLLLFLAMGISLTLPAQIGGKSTYEFLNLPPSARAAAMGGNIIGIFDEDVSLVFQNPAALDPEMHNALSFNTALYFAGINFGYLGYGRHYESIKTTFAGGLQYIAYGKFMGTDLNGNETAEFNAGEYALNLTAARQYKKFNYGAHIKLIYSGLESYSSYGLATDIAGAYIDTATKFTATVVVKNIGTQLKPYTEDNREPLPFEIQAGISKQLKYMPFRFSVVVHNLQRPDIRYNDPNFTPEPTIFGDTTEVVKEKKYIADKIAYHFIFGGEFLLGNSFRIRGGYNHMRRQNLSLDTRRGLSGFSVGAGLRISKFRIDYGFAKYHLAGASHQFSLSTNLSDFLPGVK